MLLLLLLLRSKFTIAKASTMDDPFVGIYASKDENVLNFHELFDEIDKLWPKFNILDVLKSKVKYFNFLIFVEICLEDLTKSSVDFCKNSVNQSKTFSKTSTIYCTSSSRKVRARVRVCKLSKLPKKFLNKTFERLQL